MAKKEKQAQGKRERKKKNVRYFQNPRFCEIIKKLHNFKQQGNSLNGFVEFQ